MNGLINSAFVRPAANSRQDNEAISNDAFRKPKSTGKDKQIRAKTHIQPPKMIAIKGDSRHNKVATQSQLTLPGRSTLESISRGNALYNAANKKAEAPSKTQSQIPDLIA